MTRIEQLLNRVKSNKLIAIVIVCALVVVSIGRFTNAVRDIKDFLNSFLKKNSLEIVDARTEKSVHFPVVDLKLRNPGSEIAYVNAIEFEVLREKITGYEKAAFYALPSTWQYNVLLQPGSPARHYELAVSQVVPPNGVDRFYIVVGQASGYGKIRFVDYKLRLRIRYNQGRSIISPPFDLRVPSPVYFLTPKHLIGLSVNERITALESLDPRDVGEAAIILGVIREYKAVDALRAIFDKNPSIYTTYAKKTVSDFPDIDPIIGAHLEAQQFKVRRTLIEMYSSVFWALEHITGHYHQELIQNIRNEYRPLVVEALKEAREDSYPE